jgi:hypothetical protein
MTGPSSTGGTMVRFIFPIGNKLEWQINAPRKMLRRLLAFVIVTVSVAQLMLDPHDVASSFNLFRAIVPENDTTCALEPGPHRLLLGFSALADNIGNTVIRDWTFEWSYTCAVSRSGVIHANCTNDAVCRGKKRKYYSCAASGVQPGCQTRVQPKPCQFIDMTGADVPNCVLTIDNHDYDLSSLQLEPDPFVPKFILVLSVTVSITVIALVRALTA